MTQRKGIVLAGGTGTRLYPLTQAVSKQLMPVYDKPMIYYPISVLMLAGIRDVAIITTREDQSQFRQLLGDGSQWGMSFEYIVQPNPEGLAQAYVLAEDYLSGTPSTMVLGDNIFYGHRLSELLQDAGQRPSGATVFGYHVSNPSRYGVVGFDSDGKVSEIVEKPSVPPSNFALTGLYFLDGSAPERAKSVTLSERGELEIVTLLQSYLREGRLSVETMGRGYAWLDTGTHESLHDAANFVQTVTKRQGLQVGCPEEIAFRNGWISEDQLADLANRYSLSSYGSYLAQLTST